MFDVKKFDTMRDDEIITTVKSWKLKKTGLLDAIEFIEYGFKRGLSKPSYDNYYMELYKWEQDHENINIRTNKGGRKAFYSRSKSDLEKLLSELIRLASI